MNGGKNGDLSDHGNAVSFVELAIIIVRLSQMSGHTAVQHACNDFT